MDHTGVVAPCSGANDKGTSVHTTITGQSSVTKQKRRIASSSQETRTMYLHALREKYRMKGFSSKSVELILKSWRKSTLNQYLVYAKLWFNFSMQGLRPTIRNIVEFLVHLHSKGFNQKQIRQARSAVSILSDVDKIGQQFDNIAL